MKQLSTSAVALIAATFFAGTAGAADILDARNDPAPDYDEPAGVNVNWSGGYIGGRLGYGNANHDLTLSEYFKDYCAEKGDKTVGFLENGEIDPGALWTVDNILADDPEITGITCETLAKKEVFDPGYAALNTAPVGPNAGYATVPGDSRDVANLDGVNSHGVIGGFQAGYDQQVYNWVFGIFGNYNFSGMETTATGDFSLIDADSLKIEKDDEWTIGIRAGHLLSERTLLYGLVGYTQTDYKFTVSPDVDGLKNNVTFDGVTFGAGLEHAVTQNVFLGIEGSHTIYGDETIFDNYVEADNVGTKVVDDLSETRVMGTLKIKLNSF